MPPREARSSSPHCRARPRPTCRPGPRGLAVAADKTAPTSGGVGRGFAATGAAALPGGTGWSSCRSSGEEDFLEAGVRIHVVKRLAELCDGTAEPLHAAIQDQDVRA